MTNHLVEMSVIDFASAFEPVIALFGPNKFPQVRIAAYHEDLKHFSDDEMEELVGFILKNYFSPPTINHLKREAHAIFKKANERREIEISKMLGDKACQYCGNSGIAMAVLMKSPESGPFAFRCQCKAGHLKTDGMPRYTAPYAKLFRILKESDSETTSSYSLQDLPKLKSI